MIRGRVEVTSVPEVLAVDERLKAAVAGIVELAKPEAVLLFGSRARGDHDKWSDWDLLVVVPDVTPPGSLTPALLREAARSRALIPIDAHACRRSVFEAKRHDVNSLSQDAVAEGIVVYGSLGA